MSARTPLEANGRLKVILDFDNTIARQSKNTQQLAVTRPTIDLFDESAIPHWDHVTISILPGWLVQFRPGLAAFFAVLKQLGCDIFIVSRADVVFLRCIARYFCDLGVPLNYVLGVPRERHKVFTDIFELRCPAKDVFVFDDDVDVWRSTPVPVCPVTPFTGGELKLPNDLLALFCQEAVRRKLQPESVSKALSEFTGTPGACVNDVVVAAVFVLVDWKEPRIEWCRECLKYKVVHVH